MNREEFIKRIDEKLKLIRNEKNYSQDRMCEIIGISKKTLIQIEKGRASLGWSGAVVICTLFKDSEILKMTFGEDIDDIIISLAFGKYENNYKKTMGGRVWWKELKNNNHYKLQQNIISGHFRILDKKDRRILSSFDEEYINLRFKELKDM